jgi:hypothetical protein
MFQMLMWNFDKKIEKTINITPKYILSSYYFTIGICNVMHSLFEI